MDEFYDIDKLIFGRTKEEEEDAELAAAIESIRDDPQAIEYTFEDDHLKNIEVYTHIEQKNECTTPFVDSKKEPNQCEYHVANEDEYNDKYNFNTTNKISNTSSTNNITYVLQNLDTFQYVTNTTQSNHIQENYIAYYPVYTTSATSSSSSLIHPSSSPCLPSSSSLIHPSSSPCPPSSSSLIHPSSSPCLPSSSNLIHPSSSPCLPSSSGPRTYSKNATYTGKRDRIKPYSLPAKKSYNNSQGESDYNPNAIRDLLVECNSTESNTSKNRFGTINHATIGDAHLIQNLVERSLKVIQLDPKVLQYEILRDQINLDIFEEKNFAKYSSISITSESYNKHLHPNLYTREGKKIYINTYEVVLEPADPLERDNTEIGFIHPNGASGVFKIFDKLAGSGSERGTPIKFDFVREYRKNNMTTTSISGVFDTMIPSENKIKVVRLKRHCSLQDCKPVQPGTFSPFIATIYNKETGQLEVVNKRSEHDKEIGGQFMLNAFKRHKYSMTFMEHFFKDQ